MHPHGILLHGHVVVVGGAVVVVVVAPGAVVVDVEVVDVLVVVVGGQFEFAEGSSTNVEQLVIAHSPSS